MRQLKISLLIACALVSLCGVAFAQKSNEPLKVVMSASKIVASNGSETRQSAQKVKPGDIVEYTVDYTNQSSSPLRDVRGVLPIPAGMTYENGTASPAKFWASTDGKNFSPAPLKRLQKNANGTQTEVLVPVSEYRVLRWEIGEIAPKSTVTVRARVKVLTASTSAEAPPAH